MLSRFFRRRASACTEAVLRDLFARYWGTLYRQARLLLSPQRDPEDAAADVWLQVVREAKNYDPTRAALPWLARICTRVCLDRRRTRRRHWIAQETLLEVHDAPAGDATTAQATAHAGELRKALHRAVDRLAWRQREVVVMRFFFGLSIGEIAALKGMKVTTATKALVRGLRRLRVSPEAPSLRALLGTTGGSDE
jgi:RNA polymerase sigma-70 factor (ECF subfamily)